jgi:hypothetical protein
MIAMRKFLICCKVIKMVKKQKESKLLNREDIPNPSKALGKS